MALQSPSSPCSKCSRHFQSRRTESYSEQCRSSCSHSPCHWFRQPPSPKAGPLRPITSPTHRRRRLNSDPSIKSVCPVCLGRHPHRIHECNDPKLWNGEPAYARRKSDGHLINSNGATLCSDWQKPNGCSIPHKSAKHDCSGCGDPKHGAQRCHRAQAHRSANAI